MRRRVVVSLAAAAVVAWLAWPTIAMEWTLRRVPTEADAVLVEDLRRGGSICVPWACPERLQVWRSAVGSAARCESLARWIADEASDSRRLDIGRVGFARCGWIVDDGSMTLGVVVEEQSPGSDLVVTVRRER